ncbi:MAG: hypothetical protein OJF49_001066 [Ktedonobacterales bacterium]|jgi:hypothetical protein|nr:MAG: hypothetical protein OJF49_001066 [Ktedonobacterales bacterium]
MQASWRSLKFSVAQLLAELPPFRQRPIEHLADTQLTACIAYEATAVSSPDTVVGTNTRSFTLVATSDGTWQVAHMGEAGS